MRTGCRSLALVFVLVAGLSFQAGCAGKHQTQNAGAPSGGSDDISTAPLITDPLEGWNRFWFSVNDAFYRKVASPLSRAYAAVMPQYLRDRLNGVYKNALFPARFVNALLQARPDRASREFGRFLVNSTFGLGGLYDLAATKPDMAPQELDFGQTLGVWGVGHGFYLVLPVLGPSSARDGFGLIVDTMIQPTSYLGQTPYLITLGVSAGGRMNRFPETLEDYLEFMRAAVEPYTAMRDAYAQMRDKLVQDAKGPVRRR